MTTLKDPNVTGAGLKAALKRSSWTDFKVGNSLILIPATSAQVFVILEDTQIRSPGLGASVDGEVSWAALTIGFVRSRRTSVAAGRRTPGWSSGRWGLQGALDAKCQR